MINISERVKEIAGYQSFTDKDWDTYYNGTHKEAFEDCEICYKQGMIDALKGIKPNDIDFLIKTLDGIYDIRQPIAEIIQKKLNTLKETVYGKEN